MRKATKKTKRTIKAKPVVAKGTFMLKIPKALGNKLVEKNGGKSFTKYAIGVLTKAVAT